MLQRLTMIIYKLVIVFQNFPTNSPTLIVETISFLARIHLPVNLGLQSEENIR